MFNFYRLKDGGMIFRVIEMHDGRVFADAPGTQLGFEGSQEQFDERFVQMSQDDVAATPLCHLNEPLPCCRT